MKAFKFPLSIILSAILPIMFITTVSSCGGDKDGLTPEGDNSGQNQTNGGNNQGGNNQGGTSTTPINVNMSGSISHTTYTIGEKSTITFNRFPATVDEFKAVRDKIGGEPQGAVALQLMAFEMYRRNRTIGETCIKLNNTNTNVNSVVGRLKELFGTDANYARPYQVAAYLKGATPANGYNPTEPYTIELQVSPTDPYEYSSIFQTQVLFISIMKGDGTIAGRPLYVLQTKKSGEAGENGKFFVVNNSAVLHTQVAEKSFGADWKGLK